MAKENLSGAVRVVEWLAGADREAHARLVAATGLTDAEVDEWRRAAELMYVPRHEELGIVLQDEDFLARKPWDLEGTPLDRFPLLLHYHPLELYRRQVIKQTDVVLATYLAGEEFSEDEVRRTFDYYDRLTTGDSTLSASIQSVIAFAVGYPDAALEYFLDACAVDLVDAHGNTSDGIHIASCGGTWLALVAGFGGLRDFDGEVRFRPRLPDEWDRLRFRVQVRGQLLEVDMTPDATTYRLIEGHGLLVQHWDEGRAPGAGHAGAAARRGGVRTRGRVGGRGRPAAGRLSGSRRGRGAVRSRPPGAGGWSGARTAALGPRPAAQRPRPRSSPAASRGLQAQALAARAAPGGLRRERRRRRCGGRRRRGGLRAQRACGGQERPRRPRARQRGEQDD